MIRKTENFSISIIKEGQNSEKCGGVEYKMTAALAQHIMKIHKGPKKNKQDILINYVNTQLGLKDKCVRVLVDLD
jgi:glycerol-3-phosphate responsive antiterminator